MCLFETEENIEKVQKVQERQKEKEVLVIILSNAVSHPRTVVIITFYTIIALVAMGGGEWSEYHTRFAIFLLEYDAFHNKILLKSALALI
jgi:hypothetical protein